MARGIGPPSPAPAGTSYEDTQCGRPAYVDPVYEAEQESRLAAWVARTERDAYVRSVRYVCDYIVDMRITDPDLSEGLMTSRNAKAGIAPDRI